MIIRDELPGDCDGIRRLLVEAFGGPAEACLVERLREDGDMTIALVADIDGSVGGHIAFSPMTAPFPALGMAPVAVTENCRRNGIASALINRGLDLARQGGWQAVFVLGDPAYYSRFGFSANAAGGFTSPYAGPYLMVLALQANSLPVSTGTVKYARAFADLE